MTASEPAGTRSAPTGDGDDSGSGRSLAAWALDLFVYVPAGIVATALDDMDEMAAKGRVRVDQQLRNAHLVGRFAVDLGLRRMKQQADSFLAARAQHTRPAAPAPGRRETAPRTARPAPRTATASSAPRTSTTRPPARRQQPSPPEGATARDPEVDRAIPDYDTLSASQVVRRLDSLDAHQLRAVVRHELAARGRRTILHRAEQLLEGAPPAAPGAPAAP